MTHALERQLQRALPDDLSKVQVGTLHKALRRLPDARREAFARSAVRVLEDAEAAEAMAVRICAAKVLVALLPDTEARVRNFLLDHFGKQTPYEAHFSLLCFLPESESFIRAKRDTERLLTVVKDYLLNVPTERALAAWMAGHALGGHWVSADAIPLLTEAAKGARFVAGREQAVMGLAERAKLLPPESRKGILTTLRQVSRTDRSSNVRSSAKMAYGLVRGR